ncbi:MAG: hypothetical protein D3914_14625 [Candidatus Electrothrix sp. LOE2]|nr:hypothetical protein [Candidatus Electrothrix sp. LOE2]
MKTQQGGFRKHRGLIARTAGAFFAAAVLATGCGGAGMSGPRSEHDILSEGQRHVTVTLPQGENRSVRDNVVDPKAVTAEHNHWRSRVGVPALRWSDKLADTAQEWADTLNREGCGFYHSRNGYGENLFMSSALIRSDGHRSLVNVTPQDAVDSWGDEIRDYNYADNSCSGVCGHYTQVVWKETKEVGCAKTVCDDKSQIWVCSYAPAGNHVGQRPY